MAFQRRIQKSWEREDVALTRVPDNRRSNADHRVTQPAFADEAHETATPLVAEGY